MAPIERILVDLEPDKKSQPALERALQFAANNKITIKLLSCVCHPSIIANNFLDKAQLDKTQAAIVKMNIKKIAELIKKHPSENVNYELEVEWLAPVYQGILKVAEDFKADLVVKATHPHPIYARRLFTPTDWQLLKSCPVPILFVKHQEWPSKASIVAALDPDHNLSKKSELDKRILQTAYDISKQLKAPLHACNCFDPSYWKILFEAVGVSGMWADVFSGNPDKDEESVMDKLRLEQNDKFAETCSELVPNSANQHLITGNLQEVLPEKLEELRTGMLVLGTTYRTGLLGSTAEKLLETVNCDVLGVKPKDFEFFV